MADKKPKVLVGMSGGVDSSLSAALLVEQGYEVIGGFMKNWDDCNWRADRRDALRVAAQLGIPLLTFDFEKEYRQNVVDYMVREYQAGRTPNPDVMCNKFMKFDLFVREADKLRCEYVATGHYARLGNREMETGIRELVLMAGADLNKDQSYFLCQIPRAVLPRVIFPIGEMTKPQVRAEAKKRNLPVAEKPDSQGVCFIGEINMKEFLEERIAKRPGKIVTTSGEVVGDHDGIAFYTIGQREGLKIGGLTTPYYVVAKNAERNELVVSSNFHQALFRDELEVTNMNWLVDSLPLFKGEMEGVEICCQARIRYRQPLEACTLMIDGDRLRVKFKTPQRAVTAGQFIVLYDKDVVLGGGVIA